MKKSVSLFTASAVLLFIYLVVASLFLVSSCSNDVSITEQPKDELIYIEK